MDFVYDISNGFLDSIRLDIYVRRIYHNDKSRETMGNILKHNIAIVLIPYLLMELIGYAIPSLLYSLWFIQYPLSIISNIIHLVYYHDLGSQYARDKGGRKKAAKKSTMPNPVIISIIMSIYQLVIVLTAHLIRSLLSQSIGIFSDLIIFTIWTIYYSIYSYNSLWQQMSLGISQRIRLHEEKWGYFFGYGAIVSLLNQSSHPLMRIVYNIYLTHLLMIPHERIDYFKDPHKPSYPSLNLGCFSYVMKKITSTIRYLLSTITSSSPS